MGGTIWHKTSLGTFLVMKIVHILSLDVPRRSDLCLVARDQSFMFVFSRVNSSNAEVFGQNMIYYSYARQQDIRFALLFV